MKKTLSFSATLLLTYLSLTGNSAGPSGSPPGVMTAKTGCSGNGCHGALVKKNPITFEYIDTVTNQVYTDYFYDPGKPYIININSFDLSAVDFGLITLITDASNKQAGKPLYIITTSSKITNINSYSVIENKEAMPTGAGHIGVTFYWVAPPKGTGDVFFNSALARTNGNGLADAGDTYDLMQVVLKERWPESIDNTAKNKMSVTAYPSPTTDKLNITILNGVQPVYCYTVYSLNGIAVTKGCISNSVQSIDVSTLATGTYLLNLNNSIQQKAISFNKL